MFTLKFKMEKETKGAVRYQEVDDEGKVLDFKAAVIGTLYLRKDKLLKGIPQVLTVTVEEG